MADATFFTDAGNVTADGTSGSLTGDATFATAEGDTTAAGGTATFNGSATFATTAGNVTAAGGTGALIPPPTQDGLFQTVTNPAGTAVAAGGEGGLGWVRPLPPPPTLGSAPGRPTAVIRLYDKSDVFIGDIDQYEQLTVTRTRGPDSGAIKLQLRNTSPGVSLLDRDVAFARVVVGGVVRPDVFILDEDDGDDRDPDAPAHIIDVTLPSVEAWLVTAKVYPETAPSGATGNAVGGAGARMFHKFAQATPGQVMKTLIDRARARGAITQVGYDFSDTHDSNGVAWAADDRFDEAYEVGTDLLQVLNAIAGVGWCEYRWNGWTLRLFRRDTLGSDRTGVVLRRGREVRRGPRKRKRLGVSTTMLVRGQDLVLYERVDPAAVAELERREGYYERGNVFQQGTVERLSDLMLGSQKKVSERVTLECVPAAMSSHPDTDFGLWDLIYYDGRQAVPGPGLEPLRVNTITEQWAADGAQVLELEVLDRVAETNDRLRRLLERVTQPQSPAPYLPPPTPGLSTDGFYQDFNDYFTDMGASWGLVFVQPDEPQGVGMGTLWFDTDDFSV